MSHDKLFVQLVQSMEDPEMDKIAQKYMEEVEGEKKLFNCNGPYDHGLDMRGFDITEINAQYQITTRANKFELKLKEDLGKAKRNVDNYNLPKKIMYFYSYPLTSNLILGFKKMAKDDFNLNLNLIEANNIAGVSAHYKTLKELILELSEYEKYQSDDKFFTDTKIKAFYDLMSFGTSTDIKHDILKSFIINYLNDNGKVSLKNSLKYLNEHFSTSIDKEYFKRFMLILKSEQRIIIDSEYIELTINEKNRIQKVIEDYKIEETLLKKDLIKILEKHNIQSEVDLIITHLGKLYESNYSSNLGEFIERKTNIQDLKTATEEFKNLLDTKIQDKLKSEILAKELLKITDKNEILSRIAAGRVYSKVNAPEKLQQYIFQNNNNKEIFLDTNVIIYLLFVHYDPEAGFSNYHFESAKQLLNFREKYNLLFLTTRTYAIETANIFKDALSIVPFTKLPIFESLGGSTNIVYNFYIHLKDQSLLEKDIDSFEEFLNEFHFKQKINDPENNYFHQIKYLLDSLSIEIETPNHYDIIKCVDLINQDLKSNEKNKSSFAINNDAIMMMRLGDDDVEINPLDPIFCTWDLALIKLRKKYFEEFTSCTKWMIYTPTRLMDHFSMMNFEVKSGTLTNEVLSILEEDYSFQSKTQSLLDTIINIINPKNEVGLKYTNRLAKIREQEIIEIDRTEDAKNTNIDTSSVDIVFKDLFVHYAFNNEKGRYFETFKSIFTKEEYFEDVFKILSEEINKVNDIGITSNALYQKIDDVMMKIK
jgi:hypothetical protein